MSAQSLEKITIEAVASVQPGVTEYVANDLDMDLLFVGDTVISSVAQAVRLAQSNGYELLSMELTFFKARDVPQLSIVPTEVTWP